MHFAENYVYLSRKSTKNIGNGNLGHTKGYNLRKSVPTDFQCITAYFRQFSISSRKFFFLLCDDFQVNENNLTGFLFDVTKRQ